MIGATRRADFVPAAIFFHEASVAGPSNTDITFCFLKMQVEMVACNRVVCLSTEF